ncbi:MAG: enoyl-CoA hydratase/isomerase family protein [Phycisphaerales bacterium]|nr:enoyl-CoA hydratase/isomerase family protein [Phycisphaerales bacterium]
MSDTVQLAVDRGIARLELDRPDKRNALSIGLINALNDAIGSIERDAEIRSVILGGRGRSFCAGMDLQGVLDDAPAMSEMLMGLSIAMRRLRRLPVPVIARIQGAAVGGGCGLCVVADFAITHPEAKLGYPEVGLGVCPAVVAPWLVRRIGAGPAREMLLAGGTMSGEEALRRGLVTSLCPQDELDGTVMELAEHLGRGGRNAIAVTKHWLNELDGSLDDGPLDRAAKLSAEVIATEEARQRLQSIFNG